MNILEHETDKYDQVWSIPQYHEHSHGEGWADLFADVTECKPGETVIDLGCGTGRGGKELEEKYGLLPTYLDLVNVDDLEPFIQQPLWKPLPRRNPSWNYGLCCDVMEHLPVEFTMLAAHNMLQACGGVFFSICFQDEAFQEMVGQPLHLTVQPFQWWLDRLRAVGTVIEARDLSPNNRLKEGVFYVTR